MFIFYIFENVLNRVYFFYGILRRDYTRKIENEGEIGQKFFTGILSLYLKYVTYKILYCQCYII